MLAREVLSRHTDVLSIRSLIFKHFAFIFAVLNFKISSYDDRKFFKKKLRVTNKFEK